MNLDIWTARPGLSSGHDLDTAPNIWTKPQVSDLDIENLDTSPPLYKERGCPDPDNPLEGDPVRPRNPLPDQNWEAWFYVAGCILFSVAGLVRSLAGGLRWRR